MTGPAPSAFPLPIAVSSAGDLFDASEADPGMELRDYFACAAMQGHMANSKCMPDSTIGEMAYTVADKMMKARERT